MQNSFYPLKNIRCQGPLLISKQYRDTKDPCPVFDGTKWHIYGSGGSSVVEEWQILHATAPTLEGPWEEQDPATLVGLYGPHIAAPSVVYDPNEKLFHMFIQVDFLSLNGTIEHLVSPDGEIFERVSSTLNPIPNTAEAGLYDPHAAEINGEKYITYSGIAEVGRPDLYIAKSSSGTWYGPWQRLGKILEHEQVPFHNPKTFHDYEWGLEGSQIIGLPDGKVVLVAVCFLTEGVRGTRQRVFLSIADNPAGPYKPIAPILDPTTDIWHSGENGHAAGIVKDDRLVLFYQGRVKPQELETQPAWRYGISEIPLKELVNFY